MAPIINRIMRERVEAFDGPAHFIDLIAIGTTDNGRIRRKFRIPGKRKLFNARSGDGIHYTMKGLRWLVAEPIFDLLRPCLVAALDGPLPRRDRAGFAGSLVDRRLVRRGALDTQAELGEDR